MKQFQISAIVDEKHLWELMTLLERHARGIVARPYANGEGAAVPAKGRLKMIRGPGPGRPLLMPASTIAREAILAAVAARDVITTKEMIESTGLKKESVYRALHVLKKERVIKSVGLGQFSKGRKEAPAP